MAWAIGIYIYFNRRAKQSRCPSGKLFNAHLQHQWLAIDKVRVTSQLILTRNLHGVITGVVGAEMPIVSFSFSISLIYSCVDAATSQPTSEIEPWPDFVFLFIL